MIEERFAGLTFPADGADWDDVVRRARRAGRKRIVGVAAVALAAVAVATPALGLQRVVIEWFEAEPAPERVQLDFAQLGVGAPEGMDPGVVPGSARRVTAIHHEGKTHVLWVAPTQAGGFCFSWTGLHGGCVKDRVEPAVPVRSGDLHPFLLGASSSPDEKGIVQWVSGHLLATAAERLVAEYADGARAEIPLFWVSPPIDAGFYLYSIPPAHRSLGSHVTALVAEGPDGAVLARQTFRLTPRGERPVLRRLPDGTVVRLQERAIVEQARRLIDFRAANGSRQTLWVMPASDGGTCVASKRWSGCFPKDVAPPPLATALAGGETVLLQGRVGSEVAVIEVRYEDGNVERIEPVEGFVLHEIPPRHYAPGHRLELEIAYDRDGNELARKTWRPNSPGLYPCDEPVDQGYGVKMCP